MFWTVSGWIIALLSLIVNFLQLRKSRRMASGNTSNAVHNSGKIGDTIQQSHSGKGDNVVQGRPKK